MKIEVRATGLATGEILIDGVPRKDVRAVTIRGRVGEVWTVELELIGEPEFTGDGFQDVTPIEQEGVRRYQMAES